MPAVSAIVPVYNVEEHLPECLESLLSQTLDDIEIICVDDGSTDGSLGILESFAEKDARIRVIRQQNGGVSSARNVGFEGASGEYVIFLDSDDFFEPPMLAEMYAKGIEDDADMVVSKIRYVYEADSVSIDAPWSLKTELLPEFSPFSRSDIESNFFLLFSTAVWNKLVKRSFLQDKAIRFHTELRRAEDVPYTYAILASATRLSIIDKPLVNYRCGRPESLQSTVHERPLSICTSLGLTKSDLITLGVYDEVERQFVNAALREILYTLETVKTLQAFGELYDGVRDRYFSELGISGRDSAYFDSEGDYELYLKVLRLTPEEYLMELRNSLKQDLAASRTYSAWVRTQLENYKRAVGRNERKIAKLEERLRLVQESSAYRAGRALTWVPRRVKRIVSRDESSE